MKILLAEDDNITRRMLELSLPKWGYECKSACDGEDAWELFQLEDFDIVITDWMMPRMDGAQLVRNIRTLKKEHYAYIILLTSLDSKEYLPHGLEKGADDYIEKPFEPAELKARLKAGVRIVELERNLAASNKRMKTELKKAAATLENMLPEKNLHINNVGLNWYFKPWVYVGGDFFNVLKLDQINTGFYMIDVAGHGLSAALLTATLSHLLRPSILHGGILKSLDQNGSEHILSPSELANELNRRFLVTDADEDKYFTMLYGIINSADMTLRWVRAGHPRPMLMNSRGVELLENDNPPIGLLENIEYSEGLVQLNHGDQIFIYSDGLADAENNREEQFGIHRMINALSHGHGLETEDNVKRLVGALKEFRKETEQNDNISLLALGISLLGK